MSPKNKKVDVFFQEAQGGTETLLDAIKKNNKEKKPLARRKGKVSTIQSPSLKGVDKRKGKKVDKSPLENELLVVSFRMTKEDHDRLRIISAWERQSGMSAYLRAHVEEKWREVKKNFR